MIYYISEQMVLSTIWENLSHILFHRSFWIYDIIFLTVIDHVVCNASEKRMISLYEQFLFKLDRQGYQHTLI
jgi:hypothetical protein